jgi:hypothetical protein
VVTSSRSICDNILENLQFMSNLTEVDTGTEMLLLVAWQVRIECKSSLWRSLRTSSFSVLNEARLVSLESMRAWSLHQVTFGIGRPPRLTQRRRTVSPIPYGPNLSRTSLLSPTVYILGFSGGTAIKKLISDHFFAFFLPRSSLPMTLSLTLEILVGAFLKSTLHL